MSLPTEDGDIKADPPGFDRPAFLRQLGHEVPAFFDKALLNGRNIVETVIGHIKEFFSFRLPRHRSVFNAFTHLTAAIVACQINPLPPKPIGASLP